MCSSGANVQAACCSVEASARFSVVQRFNEDPSIPVMLLTTHVGGLGLNLTAADMVIFLEHDWNPMKDLQVSTTHVGPYFTVFGASDYCMLVRLSTASCHELTLHT